MNSDDLPNPVVPGTDHMIRTHITVLAKDNDTLHAIGRHHKIEDWENFLAVNSKNHPSITRSSKLKRYTYIVVPINKPAAYGGGVNMSSLYANTTWTGTNSDFNRLRPMKVYFQQLNERQPGTKAYDRYERYKNVDTLNEYIQVISEMKDADAKKGISRTNSPSYSQSFKWDVQAGFATGPAAIGYAKFLKPKKESENKKYNKHLPPLGKRKAPEPVVEAPPSDNDEATDDVIPPEIAAILESIEKEPRQAKIDADYSMRHTSHMQEDELNKNDDLLDIPDISGLSNEDLAGVADEVFLDSEGEEVAQALTHFSQFPLE